MEQHERNMKHLREMLCTIREQQSGWHLTSEERETTKKYIEALEAAVNALSVQVYA